MTSHPLPIPDKKARFNKGQFLEFAPRLLALMRPHIRLLLIGFFALLTASALNLLFPYLIKNYLNHNVGNALSDNLVLITFLLIALFCLQGLCFYLRHYYLQIVGLKIVTNLKTSLVSKLLEHQISFYDDAKTGDLLSRLNNDTEVLQRGLSVNVSVAVRYGIQVFFGIILMLLISAKLTLILLAIIPLLALFSLRFSKRLREASSQAQKQIGLSSVAAEEALSAIRVVKLFNAEKIEEKNYATLNQQALNYSDQRTKLAAAFSSSMVTLLHCAIALVFLSGGLLVSSQKLTIGDFTAFLLYCVIVAVSFGFLLNAWAEFVQSLGAAERIFSILDAKTESIHSTGSPYADSSDLVNNFEIEFREVSFAYPSRSELEILKEVSFKIPENKTTAFVGPSGSGKSTIVSLIPKLYPVSSGAIYLGGKNISELNTQYVRSKIAFVPQNPQLFSSTLRFNILYGKPNATEAELTQAISNAALGELVAKLPNGLDTLIGDKGIQLSGGERQRVSIARALLINPKILVLDEATSSLDSYNEKLIQQALEKAKINRTVIIIAHRLSTVKNADHIIVIKKGQVEQTGNHSDLLKEDGLYKNLVEYQLA